MGKGEEDYEGFEDEEEDDVGREEDEEDEGGSSRKRSRASQFIDDAAEEDEDEDEDEDEEDEDEEEGGGKRAKKGGGGYKRSAFIDDVAQVASEDEEEEDEEEEGFIDHDNEPAEDVGRPSVHHPRMLERDDVMNEVDEEEYARMLEERYRKASEGAMEEVEATDVEQQARLPSVRDPKLWLVRCKAGSERDAVLSLMAKFVHVNTQPNQAPMLIQSAITLDNLKEHIYVEARKEAHVREACMGNRLLYTYKITLVPIKEMAGVLTVQHKVVQLKEGAWVRVRNGVHAGDLAQVVAVDSVKSRALVKLLPRIDLQALERRQNGEKVKARKLRPPARLLSLDEAQSAGVKMDTVKNSLTRETCYAVNGQPFLQFTEHGYQLRNMAIKALDTEAVVPTLDELQKFRSTGEDEGRTWGAPGSNNLGLAPELANKTRSRLLKGDPVEVIAGDLKGIRGRVEKVEEDEVTFMPIHSELQDALVVKDHQLRKFFKMGDHVKVIAGQYNGETGMVVKVDGHVAVVISDTTRDHVKVFCRDLISSTEVTSGMSKLGEYELHDLVQLDQAMAGVIVKIEAGGCVVLKALPDRAEPVPVKLPEILRKLTHRNASAQDMDGRGIQAKDPVRVLEGTYKGRQGTAEHIYRGMVFILDKNHVENGGFLCVRSKSLRALKGNQTGNNFGRPPVRPDSRMGTSGMLRSPAHLLNSPRNSLVPMSPGRGGYGGRSFPGAYGGGRHGSRRDDMLAGRIVKIRSGPYKGYRGRVLEATDTNARVELESIMRVVTVRRDQLPDGAGGLGPSSGGPGRGRGSESPGAYRNSPWNRPRGLGSETPLHPSRTPMHPGYGSRADPTATPIHEGMRTPMRDPAWNPNYPTTPLRPDSFEEDNPATWANAPPRSEYIPYTPAFSPPDAAASPADFSAQHNAGTPGGASVYEAGTPSSMGVPNYRTPYSDAGDARTPYDAATPQSTLAASPAPPPALSPYPPAPLTASSPFIPSTPADLPMTPGDASGHHGAPDGPSGFLPGILVNVPRPGALSESIVVVIREILLDGSCRVGALGAPEEELFAVASRNIDLILPKKNERVLVLKGECRGARGKLIGVDAGDGIVKMDADSDVKILELSVLGKLASG